MDVILFLHGNENSLPETGVELEQYPYHGGLMFTTGVRVDNAKTPPHAANRID